MSAEFAKAVRSPDVRERLTKQIFTFVGSSVEESGVHLRTDIANWKRMIEVSGARIE